MKEITLLDLYAMTIPLTAAELKHLREFDVGEQHQAEATLRFEKAEAMMTKRMELEKDGTFRALELD